MKLSFQMILRFFHASLMGLMSVTCPDSVRYWVSGACWAVCGGLSVAIDTRGFHFLDCHTVLTLFGRCWRSQGKLHCFYHGEVVCQFFLWYRGPSATLMTYIRYDNSTAHNGESRVKSSHTFPRRDLRQGLSLAAERPTCDRKRARYRWTTIIRRSQADRSNRCW